MTSDTLQALRAVLATQRRNLATLQLQEASYAVSAVPLQLRNQIRNTERAIVAAEEQLWLEGIDPATVSEADIPFTESQSTSPSHIAGRQTRTAVGHQLQLPLPHYNPGEGGPTVFDQHGQHVGTQYNAGGDIYLTLAATTTAPSVITPPRLRAPIPTFCGRETERAALGSALLAGAMGTAPVVGLRGMGGVGKTELALLVGHDVAPAYPNGQLLLSLSTHRDPAHGLVDGLQVVLRQLLGHDTRLPDDTASLVALYQSVLSSQRILIIADNVSSPATLRGLLPPVGCGLLYLARTLIHLPGYQKPLLLRPLTRAQARTLLLRIEPTLGESPDLPELVRRCADLPLALQLAGAAFAASETLTVKRYLAQLDAALTHQPTASARVQNLYMILQSSVDLLQEETPLAAAAWLALHVCPATFDASLAGAIWALTDSDERDELLDLLVQRALLFYDKDTQRYHLHDLLRELAAAQCDAVQTAQIQERHAQWASQRAGLLNQQFQQGTVAMQQALQSWDEDWPHFQAGQSWAAQMWATSRSAATCTRAFGLKVPSLLEARLPVAQVVTWMECAVAAARTLDDPQALCVLLADLSIVSRQFGSPRQVRRAAAEAATLATALGHHPSLAIAEASLAVAALDQGEFATAAAHDERALAMFQALGDWRGEANVLGHMGIHAYQQMAWDRAAEQCAQALTLVQQGGDQRMEAIYLGWMGMIESKRGNHTAALVAFLADRALAQALHDQRGAAIAAWYLGIEYALHGDLAQALPLLEERVAYEAAARGQAAGYHASIVAQVKAGHIDDLEHWYLRHHRQDRTPHLM